MTVKDTFKVGELGIGYLDSDIITHYGDDVIEEVAIPTFQVLPCDLTDDGIDAQMKPGRCTMSDVYAFLKNPPEGTKDGRTNIFYVGDRVVSVSWRSYVAYWGVNGWNRDGSGWSAGSRVFSTATLGPQSLGTCSSTLEDALKIVKDAGYIVMKQV